MNKATWVSIISAAAIMVPAGAVLADSNDRTEVKLGAGASLEHRMNVGDINADGRLDVSVQSNTEDEDLDNNTDDDGDEVSDEQEDSDEVSDEQEDATAEEARDEKSTSSHGESSGFGKGGIRAFLNFFFGLPASTTVGELRAEMTATTSANASKSEGLGFWGRLFAAFRFGGGKDD